MIEDLVSVTYSFNYFHTFTVLKNTIFYFSDAPERICEKKDKVVNTIKTLLGSDVVALAQNGVRVCGYFFAHLMKNNEELTTELIQPFCRYFIRLYIRIRIQIGKSNWVVETRRKS